MHTLHTIQRGKCRQNRWNSEGFYGFWVFLHTIQRIFRVCIPLNFQRITRLVLIEGRKNRYFEQSNCLCGTYFKNLVFFVRGEKESKPGLETPPDNHQIWKFRYKWNFKNWCRFFQKTRHSSNIEILLSVGPRKRIATFKPPEINQRSKFLFGFSISKEFGICTVFFENQIYRISWLKYRGKFKSKIARIRPKIGLFRSKKCWKFEFLARSTAPALRILQRLRRQIGRRR